jgi:hypothetical protein
MIGNKSTGKISAIGNKLSMPSVLGNKILNKSTIPSSIHSNIPMHHTLVNNIANSAHSVYIPTGINSLPKSNKKSYLEKH